MAQHQSVTWPHSISEVISALIGAGLTIESFSEYPYSPYNCFEGLEWVPNLGYQKLYKDRQIPLVYSIKARKRQVIYFNAIALFCSTMLPCTELYTS